jgi:hypothetical protein
MCKTGVAAETHRRSAAFFHPSDFLLENWRRPGSYARRGSRALCEMRYPSPAAPLRHAAMRCSRPLEPGHADTINVETDGLAPEDVAQQIALACSPSRLPRG